MKTVIIDGESLSVGDVALVARYGARVKISEKAAEAVNRSAETVATIVGKEKTVYGITTGFGSFADVRVPSGDTARLQRNLLLSHCCGTGEPFGEECVRAAMTVRINSLAKGCSGIRLSVLQRLADYLNRGIHPVVPSQGSVGASGDLCPLAHMSVTLLGLGEVFYKGRRRPAGEVLDELGMEPVSLFAKEGLALINGTSFMAGIAAMAVFDARSFVKICDIAAAVSFEALHGVPAAFDARVHLLRPHPGQIGSAANMRRLTGDSEIAAAYAGSRVQDCYSLRCVPQVHGASRDGMEHVGRVVETELNSVTDNPLVFAGEETAVSCGNFHGQPLAVNMDYFGILAAELADISERRTARLVDSRLSGLPPYLIERGGLNSGFMITQYTSAAIVSENKVLAHPSSVDSIPTSANQEDHVSMGMYSAVKARRILDNAVSVLSIELFAASQALEYSRPLSPGTGVRAAYEHIRKTVPCLTEDTYMHAMINRVTGLVRDGSLLAAVEKAAGTLE